MLKAAERPMLWAPVIFFIKKTAAILKGRLPLRLLILNSSLVLAYHEFLLEALFARFDADDVESIADVAQVEPLAHA